MKRDWKPGDVAIVADENGTERIAVRGSENPRMKHSWHYDERGIGRILNPLRPLVVIDPEDREQVERLIRTWLVDDEPTEHGIDCMQAALRSLVEPEPEEPTGLGAVVRDGSGDAWLRDGIDRTERMWWSRGSNVSRSSWADLPRPITVLSEGYTEGSES